MRTFMLTYPSNVGNQILFETAKTEREAVQKFRDRLGRKLLPWKSEITMLQVDGHKIQKVEKPQTTRGKYFRWSEDNIVELLEKYSITSIGRANSEFIQDFVQRFKNDLKNR